MNPRSLFYRTDHHWTVPASLWAADKVAEKLNCNFEKTGYSIDLSLYSENNFNQVKYENAWLGEQGQLFSVNYIGADDFTMMEPDYPTSYTVIADDNSIAAEGDFNVFIDKSVYEAQGDYSFDRSWHYSYGAHNGRMIRNNNIQNGNVLIAGDSFSATMVPFLSLGLHNVKLIVLRDIEGSIRDVVEAGNYDTVIIMYTQSMIGAHDDISNANYRMFTLQ